jgi:hypothetical protein
MKIPRNNKLLFLVVFSLFSSLAFSQSLNRLNRHGKRVGKWVTYIDDDKKLKSFEGKFRNGKPVGKSYFYNNNGILDRTEVSRFRKLKTRFYYPNGVLKLSGQAKMENLPDRIHYYFYGKWKAYNDSGVLTRYDFYEKGTFVNSTYIHSGNGINDTLITTLRQIDAEFAAHNRSLTDSINAYTNDELKQARFKAAMHFKDSVSFAAIERIIQRYGYPSKQIAGEAVDIPFYILGYAPVATKEKYMNEFILAADRGTISWTSLAHFIDKVKVAKGEKQVYGTQGEYDQNFKLILYPVADPEHLNVRRKQVGLEELKE